MRAEVVGVGNAIVDIIGQVEEDFITTWELNRGTMTLVDEERAHLLTGLMPDGLKESGGSAANTMVGVASFGRAAAYIGKVGADELGQVFRHDLTVAGVQLDVPAATEGPATGRCLIQVTPDGQRTMNTFLGASARLTTDDVDEELVATARVLYCEGYLWDLEEAKEAIRYAMDIALTNGVTSSMTLSDPFCVDRHRDEWLDLIGDRVDLLFGNIHECESLLGTEDFDRIVAALREMTRFSFVTNGEHGSVVITADELLTIPAIEVRKVVDTTGAGDLYSSGVLAGMASGFDLATAAWMGSCAASEVIGHVGARPMADLSSHCGP